MRRMRRGHATDAAAGTGGGCGGDKRRMGGGLGGGRRDKRRARALRKGGVGESVQLKYPLF